MKISEFIVQAKDRLTTAGIQCADPLLHAKQMVQLGLGMTMSEMFLRWDNDLSGNDLNRLTEMMDRRVAGEPFQYIIGYEEFWNSRFHVGPSALIPRKETELLVEIFLKKENQKVKVGELGAGVGNIGISVLLERPNVEWHAFEFNPETLPYLERNQRDCGVKGHIIHAGDFFALGEKQAPYDWIISNPPYVSEEEYPTLAREIHHEPKLALLGGGSGLDVISRLISQSADWLTPSGQLLFEIGANQAEEVRILLEKAGFNTISLEKDLAGLPRVYWARRG